MAQDRVTGAVLEKYSGLRGLTGAETSVHTGAMHRLKSATQTKIKGAK